MKFTKAFTITISALTAAGVNGFELLRDYANGFRIGCATNTIHYNNRNYINAMKAFNYMVAENGCKFESIQRNKGQFNFNDCDNHLKKAQELGMDFRGHALIWHNQAPQWIHNERGEQMKQSIINHVTKVLQHYEGKIDTWDVVNEAIDDSSNGHGWKLRPSFLYNGLPNFIDVAFQAARKASPTTKLFYNDYNTEGIYAKSESVYQFVADMKKRNIPIDGVGIQYHVGINAQPRYEKINDLIGRYCKLGLEVHITELDVSCDNNCRDPDGGDSKQGQVYANALKACLNNECCTGFLVWGVGDNDSWRGGQNKPLLFNSNYQPKGQYNTLLNVLKTTPAASLDPTKPRPPPPTPTPMEGSVKLKDGWYTIKNKASGKYLVVRDNVGANRQNVELGSEPHKWKLTNVDLDAVTLTSELGNFLLDVEGASENNNANVYIYQYNGNDNQKFIIKKTKYENQYVISTKITYGDKVIDCERNGKTDGTNILQWTNEEKDNQLWTFEAISTEEEKQDATCWSSALGYGCCKSCDVFTEDEDGKWGIENDEWCGIPKSCEASKCVPVQGYPCCKSTCDVVETDSDAKWGLENDDWCVIDKSKC